jgi:hypothetical protein
MDYAVYYSSLEHTIKSSQSITISASQNPASPANSSISLTAVSRMRVYSRLQTPLRLSNSSRCYCWYYDWQNCLFSLDVSGSVIVGSPLWREDGSVICSCCWTSEKQYLSGDLSAGVVTKFYCHKSDILPMRRAKFPCLFPPGNG